MYTREEQRTTRNSQFSPSLWVLRMQLKSLDLTASSLPAEPSYWLLGVGFPLFSWFIGVHWLLFNLVCYILF